MKDNKNDIKILSGIALVCLFSFITTLVPILAKFVLAIGVACAIAVCLVILFD